MIVNIKIYFLTELQNKECMFMQENQIPEEIMEAHDFHFKVHYNEIIMGIDKEMRGLKK